MAAKKPLTLKDLKLLDGKGLRDKYKLTLERLKEKLAKSPENKENKTSVSYKKELNNLITEFNVIVKRALNLVDDDIFKKAFRSEKVFGSKAGRYLSLDASYDESRLWALRRRNAAVDLLKQYQNDLASPELQELLTNKDKKIINIVKPEKGAIDKLEHLYKYDNYKLPDAEIKQEKSIEIGKSKAPPIPKRPESKHLLDLKLAVSAQSKVKEKEVNPVEIKRAEVKPPVIQPKEVKREEVKLKADKPAAVQPTEVKRYEAKPVAIQPKEFKYEEVKRKEVKPAVVQQVPGSKAQPKAVENKPKAELMKSTVTDLRKKFEQGTAQPFSQMRKEFDKKFKPSIGPQGAKQDKPVQPGKPMTPTSAGKKLK